MLRSDPGLYGTAGEPLWSLCYRYWFWGWLFRDMRQGDVFHRAASWSHNVRLRGCLTIYMRRWLTMTAATTLVAQALEILAAAAIVPAIFYTSAVVAIVIFTVATTAWVFLSKPSAG